MCPKCSRQTLAAPISQVSTQPIPRFGRIFFTHKCAIARNLRVTKGLFQEKPLRNAPFHAILTDEHADRKDGAS